MPRGSGTACVTADGVILSGRGGDTKGHTGSIVATSVAFSPQPSAMFSPPPDFHHVELPRRLLARAAILSVRLAPLACAVATVLAGFGAAAQERPATIPTRDVDVVYRMVQPDAPGGPRALEQRMRWAATDGKLRVDPPSPGLYIIMNYKTRRLETIRDSQRMVMEMDASAAAIGPAVPSSASFKRHGEATVAGTACTEWETRDATGTPTLACLTGDGVLLRAVAAGRVLVEASSVRYGAIDPSVFEVPPGYTHVTPPPGSPPFISGARYNPVSAIVASARVRPARPARKRAPWRDPAGKFSWLKAVTLVLVLLPGIDLALAWAGGELGGRPVTEVIHGTGEWTVRFVLLSLAVTPARVVLDWPRIVLLRRILGVTAACYAGAHLSLYCVDQKWHMLTVVSEIVLRFYLTIGFVALLGLLSLAATSTDAAMRRMGRGWKRLHKLIFAIAVLALLHYFLQSKADVTAAVFVTGLYVWEVLWRLAPRAWQRSVWLLPPLAVIAAAATAGIEATWYALATGANAQRVLAANLNIAFGPRPAVEVLILGVAVFAVACLRRVRRRLPAAVRAT